MAQSGYTPILIYASGTASALPSAANLTSSANGAELALNYADGKLYYKNSSGVVTLLASAAAASGTSPGGSTTQVQYNNAGAFGGSANFVWDNSNVRLGIGTSSPATKLDVRGTPGADYGIANIFDTTSAASGVGGVLALSGYKTTTSGAAIFAKIKGIKENATAGNEAGALTFETNSGSAYTERMRITSAGNVGIGTTSPSTKLDIVGPGTGSALADGVRVSSSIGFGASYGDGLSFYNSNPSYLAQLAGIYPYTSGFSQKAGNLIFATNNSTTYAERMRIDYSGAVCINTSSSTLNGLTSQLAISINNSTSSPNAALNIRRSYDEHPGRTSNYYGVYSNVVGSTQASTFTTAGVYGEASIDNGNGVIGKSGTVTSNAYGVTGWASVDSNGYGNAFALRAYLSQTGPNPGNGNLYGLFIDLPNYEGNGSVRTIGVYYKSDYTGSQTTYAMYFVRNSNNIGSISTSTTATAYNTSSDYRLKENVQPMTNALATVAQLNPVTYTWKSTGEAGQGFIAHELQAVVPHAVTGEKDAIKTERVEVSPAVSATYDEEGNELTPAVEAVFEDREVPDYQGVDTSFLVAALTAAIQELKAIVDAQAARIAALEGN
jgi:hypothetical protein